MGDNSRAIGDDVAFDIAVEARLLSNKPTVGVLSPRK